MAFGELLKKRETRKGDRGAVEKVLNMSLL
jgi:hypothetical protein